MLISWGILSKAIVSMVVLVFDLQIHGGTWVGSSGLEGN